MRTRNRRRSLGKTRGCPAAASSALAFVTPLWRRSRQATILPASQWGMMGRTPKLAWNPMNPRPASLPEPFRTTAMSLAMASDPEAFATALQWLRKASSSACTVASAYATMPLAERLSIASLRQPSNQAKSSSHVMPSPGPVRCHWIPSRNPRSSR
eukprot:4867412-Alexandrium_andersonii.AAC.1